MERDVGTQLEWVAVIHTNTEHPHVHVALRGIRDNGTPLQLDREYVRNGIRRHAEEYCTNQLGFRSEMDVIDSERREIAAKRFTSLDRLIAWSSQVDTASLRR
jgi:type IV secretory pathway VirD2 relaxase